MTKNTGTRSLSGKNGDSGPKRHDWAAIKRAFVEGVMEDGRLIYPGPSKLADLFGVPRQKISGRANRDGWETERALRQRGVAAAAEVQKASILAAAEAMEREAAARGVEAPTSRGRRRKVDPTPPATTAPECVGNPRDQGGEPDGVGPADEDDAPTTAAPEAPVEPAPTMRELRRTLDSSAVALATTTAAFDAKAVKIAEAAMGVGARLLLGKEIKDQSGKVTGRQPPTPKEYRDTVEGIKAAHAMGRLALGQTTDNQGHSAPDGGPLKVDAEVSTNVRASGFDNLSAAELARLYAEEIRTRPEDGAGQETAGAHKGASRA